MQDALRKVPQLEKLLVALGEIPGLPRVLLTHLARAELSRLRESARQGADLPALGKIAEDVRRNLEAFARNRIQPVINGAGVLIHTNLGRSPLAESAADALRELAVNYNNLEYDLASGERGQRGQFLEAALAVLCQAEAATVVNNCASALVLVLRHLARGERNEVLISRGQLVEIGGGFRVPEIMETSGAALREVGTTNKTSLADYQDAIGPRTAMILQVHRSNFYMEGFVAEPAAEELVALGREHHLPVVVDLGSGAMAATETLGPLEHEPTPAEILASGADLVCFSGDKLFGGPQAGIIAGKSPLVAGLKSDAFFRALRCDKLILTALQQTALLYLEHAGENAGGWQRAPLPLLQMLAMPEGELRSRAEKIAAALTDLPLRAAVGAGMSRCGGGTMPKSSLPSVTLDVFPRGASLPEFARRLREGTPPVIGYIADDRLKLDLRTVFPRQDEALVKAIRAAAS